MRKLLPVNQTAKVLRNPVTNLTYTSDFPNLHKNLYLRHDPNALDNDQKLLLCARPRLINQTPVNPSPAPAGTTPIAVAGALSPAGDGSFFIIYSDNTLAGTTFYFNNALKAKPGAWTGSGQSAHDIVKLLPALYTYYWAFTNYVEGAVVDATGAVTKIVDVDYTAWLTKTNMVAMDGYIFQADYTTGYIYNSDLNNPISWTATGRILASAQPGLVMKLATVRNYLVAFKAQSIEFFENTGQPTPGSPLTAVPQLTRRYGTNSGLYFLEASDGIVFAGFDPSGKPGIFKLHFNDLGIEEISDPMIAAVLQSTIRTGAPFLGTQPNGFSQRANVISFEDKELLAFPLAIGSGLATFTYDNKIKTWAMWTTSISGAESFFPCTVIFNYNDGSGKARPMVASTNGATFYGIDFETGGTDQGSVNLDCKWCTDWYTFGTLRRKYLASLELDLTTGASGSNDNVTMYYYDNDNGVPTTSRTISSLSNSTTRVIWRRLGSFVRRRFVFKWTMGNSVRVGAVELDLNMAEDDIS